MWLLLPFSGTRGSKIKASRLEVKGGIEIKVAFPEGYEDVIRFDEKMARTDDGIKFSRVNHALLRGGD